MDGFTLPDLGWRAERLHLTQLPELQRLMEDAEDYFTCVEGRPAAPDAAAQEWEALAPGCGRADKHLWSLREATGALVGCLEATGGYPHAATCWLGLLLLHPQQRRGGRGRAVCTAFEAWASTTQDRYHGTAPPEPPCLQYSS